MVTDRLATQIEFVLEVEKLKNVLRQTLLVGGHRRENDAEHSWHLCLMAILLVEHTAADVDLSRRSAASPHGRFFPGSTAIALGAG